jgi:uncharacterized protein
MTAAFNTATSAAAIPPLAGRVNDTASMFSAPVRVEIESLLAAHERETTNQVVVATVPSLEGEDLEGYSIRLAEAWKIGQKGKDNGVILLFLKEDRKVRIEVGYGLEHRLTDLICGRIIRNHIVPNFKAGRFDEGLRSGVAAVLGTLKGVDAAVDAVEAPVEPVKDFGYYANNALQYIVAAILMGIAAAFVVGILYVFFNMAFFQTGVVGWVGFVVFTPVFFPLMLFPVISALKFAGCGDGCFTTAGIVVAGLLIGMKIYFLRARRGKTIAERFRMDLSSSSGGGSSYSSSSSWSSSSSSSYSSGGSSGFGGGGGSFGGGGASGSW